MEDGYKGCINNAGYVGTVELHGRITTIGTSNIISFLHW